MKWYLVKFDRSTTSDALWDEVQALGFHPQYTIESDEINELYVTALKKVKIGTLPAGVVEFTPIDPPQIDWNTQWAAHAPHYQEGEIHVPLERYGASTLGIIDLVPGPGFGDLSHPTTQMCLSLILMRAEGATVIDVGCGSGVLSVAAAKAGAVRVIAIDIDLKVLKHTKLNAKRNQFDRLIKVKTPTQFETLKFQVKGKLLVVMNMIMAEQKEAWPALPKLHRTEAEIITSGILAEEREKAMKLYRSWNWHIVEEVEKDGWMAFVMKAVVR
jgi:ribosomal protein L11 methyltransferase